MKSCKLSWLLVALLLLVVAVFSYKFTVGEVKPSDDGRLAVQLSKDERNGLLLEMRTWLQNSQVILAAVSSQDFAAVATIADAPDVGERKKGDLAQLWVYKFRSNGQLYLLGYSREDAVRLVYLEALGPHENFYRDLKQ